MKFAAVILLACVAASSAAFSGSLVEQSKPSLDRAIFGLRLAVSSNANKGYMQDLVNSVIENLQAQIQQAIQHVQENVVPALQAQLQGHVDNLQAVLANIQSQAGDVLAQFLTALGITQGSKAVSLVSIMAQLKEFIASAQLQLANALSPANLQEMLINAINAIVPESLKPAVLAAFGINVNNKGLIGDLWNNLFGNVWGGVVNIFNDLVANAMEAGGQALVQLQEFVGELNSALESAQVHISSSTAVIMEEILRPALGQLGSAGQILMDHLTNIANGLKP